MKEGAFALLDCLGFKGVWTRPEIKDDPEILVSFLEQVLAKAPAFASQRLAVQGLRGKVNFQIAFVSDTVAISACPSEDIQISDQERGFLVYAVACAASEITAQFFSGPTPLLLRGCITYGRHVVRSNFFLGPAVDEAAELSEVAQGAIAWLTRDAERYVSAYLDVQRRVTSTQFETLPEAGQLEIATIALSAFRELRDTNSAFFASQYPWDGLPLDIRAKLIVSICKIMFSDWSGESFLVRSVVPMKDAKPMETYVIDGLSLIPLRAHDGVVRRALGSFDTSKPSVQAKKENTARLFEACVARAASDNKKWELKMTKIRDAAGALGVTI